MIDEADTLFGTRGSSSARRELRAIVNAGHRRGATVPRAVGSTDVAEFDVYGSCALAGLGAMPETIATRSVRIRMRKRNEGQVIEPFRLSDHEVHLAATRGMLTVWGAEAIADLARARPEMPVDDREADVWEPLVAIADHAGEGWPERARDACIELTARTEYASIGTMLLASIREVMTADRMFTADLLTALHRGQGGWTPRNLDAGSLARHLAAYDIAPGTIRIKTKTAKGYYRAAFTEAWASYLPSHVTPPAA